VLPLATLAVDGRNELAYRNASSSSDAFYLIPESGFEGHGGFMPIDNDGSFANQRFPERAFGLLRHRRLFLGSGLHSAGQ
jgi:hypothetical protein